MRLLTKTTICFFASMVTLLLLTGYYLFNQFSAQLQDRSDKELLTEESGWIQYLESNVGIGGSIVLKTREVSIYPTDAPVNRYPVIRDVAGDVFNANRQMAYRELSQVVPVGGVPYQLLIRKSQEQKVALRYGFTRVILIVFAALFLFALIFNWIINRSLWIPFNRSLIKIQNAELQRMETVHFEETNTYEFNELNKALNGMAEKISRDFENMKEFTEHAAHEMQTPVAVVQSKLEVLMQASNLNDAQLQSVAEASGVLNRLGKLNQGLLLLSKIENNQYLTTEPIELGAVIRKYLALFSELIRDKQLNVETRFDGELWVKLHPVLADSLVTNLLGNAIKYNYTGGSVRISLNPAQFGIINSSRLGPIPSDKIFTRFYTAKNGGDSSNGLGLAIVSKIAAAAGLVVSYYSAAGEHTFSLAKKQA